MTPKVRILAKHGSRGRWCRVFVAPGQTRITVQWRNAPSPKEQRSFEKHEKAEALAFAVGVAETLRKGAPVVTTEPLTLQEMWDKYRDAEFPHLRPRTRELYEENFRRWALFFGWNFVAERTTPEMADTFRKELRTTISIKTGEPIALKTIRNAIDDVKRVFLWAETRELIQRNRLRLYRFKVAKEDRPAPPPEYRQDDYLKIIAQLSPDNAYQWRAWVALTIAANQGARQNAILHLTPADVDFEAGVIWWRAEWDKLGREWSQPLRPKTAEAIRVALRWRAERGYDGPWLFPSPRKARAGEPLTVSALWMALKEAEERAGVPRLKGRGGHGLRRMLAGDVAEATKDGMMGLRAIGDTDMRMAGRYLQGRDDRMRDAFEMLDEPNEETE